MKGNDSNNDNAIEAEKNTQPIEIYEHSCGYAQRSFSFRSFYRKVTTFFFFK